MTRNILLCLPLLLALCAPARAQHTSVYDMNLPAESAATCSGPLCLMTNPAGLRWSSGGEFMYLHHEGWAKDGRTATGSDGLLFSTPNFGLGVQYVRPDNDDNSRDYLKYNLVAQLFSIGDAFTMAAGLEIMDPTEIKAKVRLDYLAAIMLRPWRYVSFGMVGRHLAQAGLAGQRSNRTLDLGLAIRPLWFAPERLTLAADYRFIEDQEDPKVRFTVQASIIDGLNLFGTSDVEGNFGVGLGIDFLQFGAAGYATFGNDSGVENQGMLVLARASLDNKPGFSVLRHETAELILSEGLSTADRPRKGIFRTRRSVRDLELAIRRAARDERVDSLLIRVEPLDLSLPQVQELREAISVFKQADKKVAIYLESATNINYYLASAADAIFINPAGSLTVTGPQVQALFFGGTLEMVGVSVEANKAGKYKSAPEQFTRQEPSEASLEVLNSLADEYQNMIISAIAEGRGLEKDQVTLLLDQGLMLPGQAEEAGLVDAVVHPDGLDGELEKLLSHPASRRPDYMSERWHREQWGSKPTLAVVYASGSIQYGGGGLPGGMGARQVAQTLAALQHDSTVDAVILRIDSPGGSGLASELIWREALRLRKYKPLIVSMGGMAASGGYYIACPADWIVANPATITGSIGVFSMLFDASELYARVGISREVITRGKLSDMFTSFRERTPEERKILQKLVDGFYEGFVDRVAQGRKMTTDQVHRVAQGRVWTGRQAKREGLVDELGGLSKALDLALARLGVDPEEQIRVVHLPRRQLNLGSVLTELGIQATPVLALPPSIQATVDELSQLAALAAEPCLALMPVISLRIR